MKKLIFTLLILSVAVTAQDSSEASEPDSLYRWFPSLIAGLSTSQIAFSDWSQGGENAITWTVYSDFGIIYKTELWKFDNQLKTAYGRTKIGSQDFRTNDNEFYMESVLSYQSGWEVNPFFSNTIRTQVAEGYNYDVEPAVKTSNFFDPAYITQSIGFLYDHSENLKTRLGIALQEVITNKYRNYSDDPETPNETEAFRLDTGLESVTDAKFKIQDNFLYKSKLRLFTRFESLDIIDVRWDNTATAKINDYINVNFTLLMIYEHNVIQKPQIKQTFQLGVSFALL